MAVIHTDQKNTPLLVPALALAAVAAVVAVWWYQQSSTPTAVTPLAAVASAPSEASNNPPATATTQDLTTPKAVSQMQDDQKVLAQTIETAPQIEPIQGTVKEKPSFVSDMEWSILQAVAQQQADPDKALTALTNKVRFTKQLEVWQDLSTSAEPAKRKLLANELLADLPQRVTNEDMDLPGAQKLMTDLLQDAESDATARTRRAAKEAKRLEKAVPPKATQG